MRSRLLLVGQLALMAFVAAMLAAPTGGAADQARVSEVRARPEGGRILVSFTLDGAFDDQLRRRIDSGLPTGFSFDLRLQRDRKRWFDKDLASSEMQVVAMYNAVTREYLINFKLDGDLVESRVVRDPAALRQAMVRFDDVAAFSLAGIAPSALDRRLLVRVRAELGTKTILAVIPTKIATDWTESPKFRVGG